MLKLENISKRYKLKKRTVNAVDDISLEFNKGEFVSILGLSGSGKTTLVSQIGGLDKPTDGKLIVNGVDTTSFNAQQWTDYRKNNIGFIFQDFNLISHLTAKENIEIALSLSGLSPSKKSERAEELLEMMGIIEQKDQLPKQLSGGQKQRVAIARALSNKPDIILADEPTGALDPDTSVQIMDILQSLAKQGHLVIMVTHNKYLARDYSTRIVELDNGKVVSNEEIREYTKYEDEKLSQDPSSLQFRTTLKIAFNNLKIRKKSTIFSMVSLIPSMILIFCIINLVFNIKGYQKDFEPLSGSILNRNDMLYITPYDDDKLEWKQKAIFADIARKNFNKDNEYSFREQLLVPYNQEQIKEIENIKGIDKVFKNMYFDVEIEGSKFILVALPPKEYSKYQFSVSKDNYPNDNDEGIILSSEAAKTILGKYTKDTSALVGKDTEMKIYNYKSVPMHLETICESKNVVETKIIDSFNTDRKTTLMNNYYAGYIFTTHSYAQKLRDMLTINDFSLVSYEKPGPFSASQDLIVMGPQSISDPLKPLREKTSLQQNYDLFTFKKYDNNMKGNNYSLKYMIVTNKEFDKDSLEKLKKYGLVSESQYDKFTVQSAKRTDKYIDYTLFVSTITSVIIMLIPTLLVCVILYISILLRIKEIGILKSIGARNKDILNIFTLESGMLAFTCGIVSVIISVPIINYIRDIIEEKYRLGFYLGSNPMELNVMGILTGFIISVSVITLIGLLPGRKASKLQPNTLLKHE